MRVVVPNVIGKLMGYQWDISIMMDYSYKKWDLIVIQWDMNGIYPLVNYGKLTVCELEHAHLVR